MKVRKIITLLVALALVISCVAPMTVMAAEENVTPAYSTTVECQSGDLTLRGTLQMPTVYNNEKVPMVILSHGFMSAQFEMSNLAKVLADAGYASVRFDFAGSGVSDGEFIDMTVWTEVADLHAILDYVKTLDFVDQNNIFLSGNSFGGVVTALVAPDRAEDLNSICLWYPAMCMCDDARSGRIQTTPFDTENIPDSLQVGRYTVSKEFIETTMALYPQELAVEYTEDVLILHGTADYLVPYTYSVELAEGYESAELILVEGGGHGFWGAAFNNAAASMVEFLDEHIVGVCADTVTVTCGEGEAAVVDVTYNGDAAITSVRVDIDSELPIASIESEYEMENNDGYVVIYAADGSAIDGVLCTITYDLDVYPWYANGEYAVDVNVVDATGEDAEMIYLKGIDGAVIIENTYTAGDVNLDGIVSNVDIINLARYLVNLVELDAEQLIAADIDANGAINNTDLIKLAREIVAA